MGLLGETGRCLVFSSRAIATTSSLAINKPKVHCISLSTHNGHLT